MTEIERRRILRRRKARKRRQRQLLCMAAVTTLFVGGMLAVRAALWHNVEEAEPIITDQIISGLPDTHQYRVAIDPGHGGSDHGSTGISFMEDEMTWETANLLLELLEKDSRFDPFLTMTQEQMDDPYNRVKPSQRGQFASEQNAELLISIHGNSDSREDTSGFECFPVPPGRDYHEESQRLGELIAAQFEEDGQRLRGINGVRYLYYDENDNKVIVESGSDHMQGTPTFTLLETCGCPAVLVEQCFITSREDTLRYGGNEGCARAAALYYQAILDYYGLA